MFFYSTDKIGNNFINYALNERNKRLKVKVKRLKWRKKYFEYIPEFTFAWSLTKSYVTGKKFH